MKLKDKYYIIFILSLIGMVLSCVWYYADMNISFLYLALIYLINYSLIKDIIDSHDKIKKVGK